ncbi:hypothetical protein BDF20DRAFT_872249 [Mycotypha africana]|uniref:uncharacterized protein n=1 Tax=Mycotypha africana TaxID=64632 RepID=UPI0023007322|nr:uncharacterized protein BDF20DRAFT_872249 [Mycotypha africana]KAI8976994.1 hypothetical protein BDF20DRAFT_872249 [Mycotypha africana]
MNDLNRISFLSYSRFIFSNKTLFLSLTYLLYIVIQSIQMTVLIRQIRAFLSENTSLLSPTTSSSSTANTASRKSSRANNHSKRKRKPSLTVTISKEPPKIVYFEKDILEEQFVEYIFDPQVHHDEEKDHPDLYLYDRRKKDLLKPWQKAPYCSTNSASKKASLFLHKLKFVKPATTVTASS